MALGFRLFLLVLFGTYVSAADDAEFAFNLLSDIAPILALFGDQFAKQFTSESHTWLDHLITAMVPLGIITAITGAIRVQGMPIAKAFIGRARENRAQVEIELMSSTSGEVCEIYNGSSIVRAMGQPKIAQFLIFPERYDFIERKYKSFDEGSTNIPQENESEYASCGIHSLESAFDAEVMDCDVFRSKSSIYFRGGWKATKQLAQPWFRFLHPEINRNSQTGRLNVNDTEQGQGGVTADSGTPPVSRRSELPTGAEDVFQNPPNIQLNISSDHFSNRTMKKGHEIFLAVTIGLLLQTGLIAIAAVTAFRISPNSSSLLESTVYGFPCYVGGSLLLSIGTGLCSFIVEHTTDEYSWESRSIKKESAPRLLWLQQKQSVNDQSFNGYVISSGPKRRVITSSRGEGPEKKQESHKSKTFLSSGREIPEMQRDSDKSQTRDAGFWEWLTVAAALSAGLGFTAQFMGLRGLAFPSSIAQLGSIFIMALVRAGIRRRLGRPIKHCIAFQWYEIDFLAAQIALYPDVRNFDGRSLDIDKRPKPEDYFGWKINTRHPQNNDRFLVCQLPGNITESVPIKLTPTSQQLLRIRKRLADLTKWKTRSSASAIALVRSIQLVMNTLFRKPRDKSDSVTWILQATFPQASERQDSIKFSIAPNTNGMWDVDAGLIDAAMSLWMAGIDADRSYTTNRAKDQCESQLTPQNHEQSTDPLTTDWRFSKDDDNLRYRFYRIIGDNLKDGVLKRDIFWWADSVNVVESERRQDMAKDDELVIGFNGIEPNDVSIEFGISSEAPLPTILAQHLFTSFMWTVAQDLPKDCLDPTGDSARKEVEVEGGHTFEYFNFQQTWPWLRLRCRRLTEVVRKMESFGMGTTHDILLCMIPALSYMGLLPNQAVLELIPHVGPGSGWAETASCHRQLLEAIQEDRINPRDKIHVGIVTAAIDFLSFACEPDGEHTEPPADLSDELSGIVESLCLPIFADLMGKLVLVYRRQHRQFAFQSIFYRFHRLLEGCDEIQVSRFLSNLHQNSTENIFGFSDYHRRIFAMDAGIQHLDGLDHFHAFIANESSTFAKDIFGWTPYHYMSVRENGGLLRDLLIRSNILRGRLPKLLCAYSRNPIHLAALEGIRSNLEPMLQSLSDEMRRHIYQTSGIDGMTPLHLIAKRGHVSCLDLVTPKGETLPLLTNKDAWGRQALHVASSSGLERMCIKLLDVGARSDQLDDSGRSSVDYFLHSKRKSINKNNIQDCLGLAETGKGLTETYLNKEESQQFFRFAMASPACRYGHGRTFLHSAVELAHPDSIGDLLRRQFDLEAHDHDHRTPLHYAAIAGRVDMVTALIDGFDVDVWVGDMMKKKHLAANFLACDSNGTTSLMFAVGRKLKSVINALLSEPGRVDIHQVDGDGKTALFYAHDRRLVEYLLDRGFETTARDSAGRTRLHIAIDRKEEDIASYLLQFEDRNEIRDSPFDRKGESLLIAACRSGLSKLVKPIHERWEYILNKADSDFDKSPLAWACEGGHTSVVIELLRFYEVDVNQAASKWYNWTPLHFSVLEDETEILDLLLRDKRIDLNRETKSGQTALERAIGSGRISAARKLLLHDQTVFSQRVKALKLLVPLSPKNASKEVMALVSDGLRGIKDEKLICEFLVWLVSDGTSVTDGFDKARGVSTGSNETQAHRSVAVFLTPLVTFIIREGWESIGDPYNLVMLLGDGALRETLKVQNLNDRGFDSDGWSFVDYIKHFDRKGAMEALVGRLRQLEREAV